jgi:hypothetical protein
MSWTVFYSALAGAVSTGLLQSITAIFVRKREKKSMLTAISAEVDSICRLIKHRKYVELIEQILKNSLGEQNVVHIVIDIRENYFSVYESLTSKIGKLSPEDVVKIVNFYAYCKSLIDSTRPDGPMATSEDADQNAASMHELLLIMKAILKLGEEISMKPKAKMLKPRLLK